MKETPPEELRFQVLPLRVVPEGPLMDARELSPRPAANHPPIIVRHSRGPPDATRRVR